MRARGFRLLADPWFAREGAFLGSWHQYPRNDHLDSADQLDVDWVAVSHEHLDHMDSSVLRRLPDRTRILIPRYPSRNFRDRLVRMGIRRIIELAPWEPFPLDTEGSWICAIPEQSPMCHDAAFLLVADGCSVLDCNDARLTAAQARRASVLAGGRLNLMALQTSGASWHPICYDYPRDVVVRVEEQKRIAKLRAVQRLVRAARPSLAVPFAGPPCFLDGDLTRFNASLRPPGIFPDAEQSVEWLTEHQPDQDWAHFRPGDVIDLDTGQISRDPVSARFNYRTGEDGRGLDEYLSRYARDRAPALAAVHAAHPEPGPELAATFAAHFGHLAALSPYFLSRIGMTVRFAVTGPHGGNWDVRMDADGLRVDLTGQESEPAYTFTVAGRWLAAVLDGRIGWEDLLLSLRLTAHRDPDRYNDYLIGLLKHANEPALQAVQDYETNRADDERIVVDGVEIDRYCPHAGEDLTIGAVVVDGVLHCLAHNFTFDLRSGECLNARCRPLRSQVLRSDALPGGAPYRAAR